MKIFEDPQDPTMTVGDIAWDAESHPTDPGWVIKVRDYAGSGCALEPLGGAVDRERDAGYLDLERAAHEAVKFWSS